MKAKPKYRRVSQIGFIRGLLLLGIVSLPMNKAYAQASPVQIVTGTPGVGTDSPDVLFVRCRSRTSVRLRRRTS